jgi:hypothetical protein
VANLEAIQTVSRQLCRNRASALINFECEPAQAQALQTELGNLRREIELQFQQEIKDEIDKTWRITQEKIDQLRHVLLTKMENQQDEIEKRLLAKIAEQQAKIDEQQVKIAELQSMVDRLSTAVSAMPQVI